MGCCPPQGRELLQNNINNYLTDKFGCRPPQGRELLHEHGRSERRHEHVAVPRRGASCYFRRSDGRELTSPLLSPAGARAVTRLRI